MSRCFPFPPPGYLRNHGARSEALIESIKLQRETEKAKEDRKREKKEKKEKREKKREKKEKKEKRKEKKEKKLKEGSTSLASDCKKLKHIDKVKEVKADGKFQKAEENENEQFERSGITEEHDQPVSSREPCCLSDSTQSSGKRKRSCSPSSQDNGPPIKIRLPLRKHKEPEEPKLENKVGSSGRTPGIKDSSTKGSREGDSHHSPQGCFTKAETNHIPGKSESVQIKAETNHFPGKSDYRHCKAVTNSIPRKPDSRHSKAAKNLVHGEVDDVGARMVSVYNYLFQNPPALEPFNSEDDQEWLFSSKPSDAGPDSTKVKYDADAFRCCSTPSSLWPRAQYIPEVDIYAFPYTVPF